MAAGPHILRFLESWILVMLPPLLKNPPLFLTGRGLLTVLAGRKAMVYTHSHSNVFQVHAVGRVCYTQTLCFLPGRRGQQMPPNSTVPSYPKCTPVIILPEDLGH